MAFSARSPFISAAPRETCGTRRSRCSEVFTQVRGFTAPRSGRSAPIRVPCPARWNQRRTKRYARNCPVSNSSGSVNVALSKGTS